MPHDAAFHQGRPCLLRQSRSSKKEAKYFLKLYPVTINHPDLTVSIFMENSIGLKRVKVQEITFMVMKKMVLRQVILASTASSVLQTDDEIFI